MDLREKIGQRLFAGFPGTEMNEEFINLVKEYKVSNVILFKHNIVNKEQLKKLCADIQKLVKAETGHPALIGTDQEGGVITRLPSDCVNVPGAMAIAATGVLENATQMGEYFRTKLNALKEKHPVIREVRGLGCMIGVDVGDSVKKIFAACREQGLLVLTAGETAIRLMPALTITKETADEALAIFEKALA